MTLQASGAISISDINVELRRAGATPASLNDSLLRGLAGKPSGVITLSDFYGKTYFTAQWSGNSIGPADSIGDTKGFTVSSNLWRSYWNGSNGAWITCNTNGTFSTTLSASLKGSYYLGYDTSGNLARCAGYLSAWGYSGWLAFNLGSGWATGRISKAQGNFWIALEGSGGLVRGGGSYGITENTGLMGPYQSLT